MDEMEARAEQEFGELGTQIRHWEQTPVDLTTEDDSELESHLWTRIGIQAGDAELETVNEMTPDVGAYFVTRLFEWLTANDGADAFPSYYPDLLDLLPASYRHLRMTKQAETAERFVAMPAAQRLTTDEEYMLTDAELEELNRLVEAIGMNDSARLDFARAHPESFSV